uniref:Glycoside hydrolase family 28 protein n=1 Tax=Panagrolaimus superbus TaxID=310955 RepID=A0A914Z5W6_9BILA
MKSAKNIEYFVGILLALTFGHAAVIRYSGIANDFSSSTGLVNAALLNVTLNSLKSGDEFIIPANKYFTDGGIVVKDISNVILHFEGSLIFNNNTKIWPKTADGKVLECLYFENISNVTFTSSNIGLFDGQGEVWWGLLGYAEYLENRPRILTIVGSQNLLLENLYFKNSPYWTVWIHEVDGLEIRHCNISARRNDFDGHDDFNLVAFNTDGFDVTGKNVWIHDCTIWNQDDCIAVKDGSENMLFERINASGLGLVIGSIGGSTVKNITFRNSYLHKTYKGIYTKFRGPGIIQDVLYENIVMFEPEQWPIWIGPAQQADDVDICKADPCSLCWPEDSSAQCNMPAGAQYINLILRNITVINPAKRTGIILGSATHPIQNITFDNVVVQNATEEYFLCQNVVNGIAIGGTSPIPSCFNK